MKNEDEWTLGCPSDIIDKTKAYLLKHSITQKEYTRVMLDPDRIKGAFGSVPHTVSEDRLGLESMDELAKKVAEKMVNKHLKKMMADIE